MPVFAFDAWLRHDFRVEHMGNEIADLTGQFFAIFHDTGFAAVDFFAEFQSRGDTRLC